MAPREGESSGSSGPATSGEVEQEMLEEMVAKDVLFQDEADDDDVIQNLNKMGKMKLFTPEWIENAKKEHRIHIGFLMKIRDEMLENRNAAAAAAADAESSG